MPAKGVDVAVIEQRDEDQEGGKEGTPKREKLLT